MTSTGSLGAPPQLGSSVLTGMNRDTSNRILLNLSDDDFGLLSSRMIEVDLPARRKLEISNRHIEHVYFMESGIASVVANGVGDRGIEIALIGREGATGIPVIMGADRWPNDTFMQSAGAGRRIATSDLEDSLKQSSTLHSSLLNYCQAFMVQVSQTAVANGRAKIEQRLARWLCMAHDRLDGNELNLTHDFLALTLGVRRPGVTLALDQLQRDGIITVRRGRITIVNRGLLERRTNGAYGRSEVELARLLKPNSQNAPNS
jgi:CRP-like cAMP-binding protein